MKKLRNTIGAMAVLAVGIEGAQASADQSQETIQMGVYYALTADAARALDINLSRLIEDVQLHNRQQLAFQVQEDGELNLSIYEDGAFTSLRSDIVKRAAE